MVKFQNKEHAPTYKDVPIIKSLRTCSTVLQKEGDSIRPQSKEDLKAAEKWLDWQEVLTALKNQETKFEVAVGLNKAKEMAKLVLISMYIRIPPSRGLEVRTLRLIRENVIPKPSTNWQRDYRSQNIIYLLEDGSIELHFQHFKTAKTFGADHLNLEVSQNSMQNNKSLVHL